MSATSRIRLLVHREMVEQRRQPLMLLTITTLYAVVGLIGVVGSATLDHAEQDPGMRTMLTRFLGESFLTGLGTLQDSTLQLTVFLAVSQYLGVCSVLAGQGMLHERQCGTYPFLLLAPVRRLELLVGKVVGALLLPTVLYLVVGTGTSLALSFSGAADRAPWMTVPHPSWFLGMGAAAPAWTLACASMCTLISAASRDVRTAQQGVWLVVFFATVAIGPLVVSTLPLGMAMQLASTATAFLSAGSLLYAGALLTRRDLDR